MDIRRSKEMDSRIIKIFFKNTQINKSNLYKLQRNKYKYNNIKNYLLNCYNNIYNYTEILYRILFNINEDVKCKYCGSSVKFNVSKKSYNEYCSIKCKHYGDINKIKNTKIKKYGNPNYNNIEKCKYTKLKKYGNPNYNNIEKHKLTCLQKYNVNNIFKSEIFKKNYNKKLEIINIKKYDTHKQNNSFNISKQEDECYNILKEKYPDIIRQYKSDKYPFTCDFYIPSLDLYIEYNGSWTHGGKPFEGTKEDNIKLEYWKSKNTKYYNNAIQTWTIRDPQKRKIAKENNLNYIELWNMKNTINI